MTRTPRVQSVRPDSNVSRQCFTCIHLFLTAETLCCAAFPDGIPEAIITGDFDHSKPYPGDHGIRYESE